MGLTAYPAGGGGGGSSTFAGLSDKATADLPAINTPLADALDAKEDALTEASQAEMEAGTEAALRSMSPQRVAQAIAALLSDLAASGIENDSADVAGDTVADALDSLFALIGTGGSDQSLNTDDEVSFARLQVNGIDSDTETPQFIGFSAVNGAARFQLMEAITWQVEPGGKAVFHSYWGIDIRGNQQDSADDHWPTAGMGDAAVSVINALDVPALVVLGMDGQTQPLQAWQDFEGTTLAAVSAAGAFSGDAGGMTPGSLNATPWDTSAPATITAAIDRLAAAVSGLLAGAIP